MAETMSNAKTEDNALCAPPGVPRLLLRWRAFRHGLKAVSGWGAEWFLHAFTCHEEVFLV